ncbi:hypothetical protein ABTA82_19690, partial [Acinetobacter baumannii]
VAEATLLVKTARYRLPFCADVTENSASVVVVAPETLVKLSPPSVDTCHWTVGVGEPVAAAVKVAPVPVDAV